MSQMQCNRQTHCCRTSPMKDGAVWESHQNSEGWMGCQAVSVAEGVQQVNPDACTKLTDVQLRLCAGSPRFSVTGSGAIGLQFAFYFSLAAHLQRGQFAFRIADANPLQRCGFINTDNIVRGAVAKMVSRCPV